MFILLCDLEKGKKIKFNSQDCFDLLYDSNTFTEKQPNKKLCTKYSSINFKFMIAKNHMINYISEDIQFVVNGTNSE